MKERFKSIWLCRCYVCGLAWYKAWHAARAESWGAAGRCAPPDFCRFSTGRYQCFRSDGSLYALKFVLWCFNLLSVVWPMGARLQLQASKEDCTPARVFQLAQGWDAPNSAGFSSLPLCISSEWWSGYKSRRKLNCLPPPVLEYFILPYRRWEEHLWSLLPHCSFSTHCSLSGFTPGVCAWQPVRPLEFRWKDSQWGYRRRVIFVADLPATTCWRLNASRCFWKTFCSTRHMPFSPLGTCRGLIGQSSFLSVGCCTLSLKAQLNRSSLLVCSA